jgi:rod shape-determining protein MreD
VTRPPSPGRVTKDAGSVNGARMFILGLAIALTVVLQGVLVARVPLPGGRPSLGLLLVVAVALASGVNAGLATGFVTGLTMDLLSDHPVGVLALCFALVGFAVGLLETTPDRSVFWPMVVVAFAAAGAQLVFAAISAALGHGGGGTALNELPAAVAYDVLLTPFVVPVVATVERKVRSSHG